MASSFEKYQKRRLLSSYLSVVISISLVLFLLGLLGLLVLNSKKVGDHLKEQVPIVIFLRDDAKEVEVQQLRRSLELADYVKNTNYVSKEEAAEEHMAEIGEDYISYLGDNPLQDNIDVRLNADFVTPEKVEAIIAELSEKPFIEEVGYDKPLIEQLALNVKRIGFWILVIAAVFLVIAILLINSSIRLSVYSKRFTIKTMQMVGATKGFIRRPFIWKSIRLGMTGAGLAMIGMAIVLYYLDRAFPEFGLIKDVFLLGGLFSFIFFMGFIISWMSTFFATQRFLNLRTDELYY